MKEICNFFEVYKGAVTGDTQEFILVENCSEFDTALQNYTIICRQENLAALLKWIEDEGFGMGGYVADCFNVGQFNTALMIVRGSLQITSFTGEFVQERGSIQAFLDYYGKEDDISFADQQMAIPQDSYVGLESLQAMSDEVPMDYSESGEYQAQMYPPEQDYQTTLEPVPEQGYQTTLEPVPEQGYSPEGYPQEPMSEQGYSPEGYQQEQMPEQGYSPEGYPQEPMPEQGYQGNILSDEEYSALNSQEEFAGISLEKPKESADVSLEKSEGIFAEESNEASEEVMHGVEYSVECEGLDIEGVTFKDGKVSIPFSSLSSIVSCMVSAVSKLTNEEIKGVQVLTREDCKEAAELVDQYAPSVIKDFILYEIMNAESDAEIIRLTAVLNDFCTYVRDRNIDRF